MADIQSNPTATTNTRLIPVHARADILPEYIGTPVETLLAHHAFGEPAPASPDPRMVIVTCMDFRIDLKMPPEFAFVARTAGANVESVVFNVACGLALRPVRTVAVIGHSDCAMVDVGRHRDAFLETIPRLGPLSAAEAGDMFERGAVEYGAVDAVSHVLQQCAMLREMFPSVLVAPLFYDVADGSLAQIVDPEGTAASK